MIEVDNARVTSILSTKRKRMLVIDMNKIYTLNKSSKEMVLLSNNNFTYSWNCKNRECSGRATSQREDLNGNDINVILAKGIAIKFYRIVFYL
jgi:hypothetical protein